MQRSLALPSGGMESTVRSPGKSLGGGPGDGAHRSSEIQESLTVKMG